MKADQRFTIAAISLFCITCAGTTMALVSLDGPIGSGTGSGSIVGQQTDGTLRPSLDPERPRQSLTLRESLDQPLSADDRAADLEAAPEPFPALRPQLADRHPRLAFIDPGVGIIALPDEPVTAAGTPDSWSVEITEQPVTSARPKMTVPRTSTRSKRKKRYTLKQRLEEITHSTLSRVEAKFEKAKVAWPPAEISLVGIKDEKALELYARPSTGEWTFVHRYKVLAASGATGPKLVRGDKQVPEGVYRIAYLNPNSAYHVSLRVNYPNAFDRKMAQKDGRTDLGGDIMIHGKNVSAGCLAVGDPSAEELFLIAAEVGMRNIKVVIAPTDFRKTPPSELLKHRKPTQSPEWVPALYTQIASEMTDFKQPPPPPSLLSVLGF